jgi:hypothetical protein
MPPHDTLGTSVALRSLAPSSIRAMPDVLTWHGIEDVLDTIHESWQAHIGGVLDRFLRSGAPVTDAIGSQLRVLRSVDQSAYDGLLLAPETVFRLLPGRPSSIHETLEFLRRSVSAEMALAGASEPQQEELWTAVGDACITVDGEVRRFAAVEGLMPIDADSPHSRDIDLTGDEYRIPTPRPPMSPDELYRTLEQLAAIRDALPATSPILLPFVTRFTKVLVLQKDESQPFSSGSNGDYVGRSVIANPHKVQDVDLADAVVHEAIHALLYMQEEQQPWVLAPELWEPIPRTVSPWSGRPLPIRQFLQACFVWYGLLHLWALAGQHGSFANPRLRQLFKRAAGGFVRGSLASILEPYAGGLTEDIVATVVEMQDRVRAALPT